VGRIGGGVGVAGGNTAAAEFGEHTHAHVGRGGNVVGHASRASTQPKHI
jgi:hypothetical protein